MRKNNPPSKDSKQIGAMYRQGDLLILEIDKIPREIPMKPSPIVLEGEITGHAHRLQNGLVYENDLELYVHADSGAMLVHDEHAPIVLNEGDYRVIRQREYIVSESEEDIEFTVVLD